MNHATVLDDVASVIGFTAACALAAWYGGKNVYVPGRLDAPHPLANVIGEAPLRALVREFGGETLSLPRDPPFARYRRDRSIAERYAEGCAPAQVADEFDLTLRRAQQLRLELVERGWVAYAAGRMAPATPA